MSLVCRGKIELAFGFHANVDGSGLAAVPRGCLVRPIWDIFDRVVASRVRFGEIGRGADYDGADHLRVHVAQQWHVSSVVKLKAQSLALVEGANCVAQVLFTGNARPKDVVRNVIIIAENNRGALLDD